MQYTFALIVEKALQYLNCTPVYLYSAPMSPVKDIAVYHHHNPFSSSCIYLIDNTKGTKPLSSCVPINNVIYLSSPTEFSPDFLSFDCCRKWILGREDTCSLLVLPPTVSRRQAESALMKAFFFYNNWSESVLQLMRSHGDWFSFIDLAHDILQNPMIIYDSSMKLLAYTRNDGSSDALWNDTVSAGAARTNSMEDSLELLKYVEKLDQYEKPFRHSGKGMTDPFYNCNIMVNGHRAGMITEMEHNCTVTQGHLDLLWNFSDLLSIQMQQEDMQKQNAGIANRQLIQDLLNGTITSENLLTTRLVAIHWQIFPVMRILRFAPSIPYISEDQWSQGLEALSALPLHGIGSLFPDKILYICTTQTVEIPSSILEAIRLICRQYHFRCGFSDPFSSLLEVNRYSRQPELALTFSSEELCFYQDVRFANLRQHLENYENPEDLVHPAVLQLKQIDETTGSDYLQTLQALFKSQYSQVAAALSLGIHRTTLFYRLQKIEELTGIRLNDAETMLHIQISLLICSNIR